ncbi:MAG: LuxR C-terminal-related transcriptional regulator [Acidimicrobiales bacterium]
MVLGTKLHAPRRRRGLVERPRLVGRLAGADPPGLILVSAPAGFGKTTLLAEWFGAGSTAGRHPAARRTAWLSLDASDDDPAAFWSAVVAALQTVAPGVGAEASALLQAAQPAETIVASLLNDMAEGAGTDLTLVLDDYHVITSAEIHAGVAFLVDHLPANIRLVLAGRADPPLPLARLRATGDLLEIRAADLRFTAAETGTYLNQVMGLTLGEHEVTALEARTEGWIAALQLAALSMQGRDDPAAFVASFAGDDRFVVDYLAEEVLERQPPEVRRFLLHTAVLTRLTGPLCDAVTGTTGGRAMLERLERANLFLVPLDDRRRWYRYHHLFADVLQARLLDEEPELVDQLHGRAAAWFEEAAEPAEAISHALAGHDTERAARLIELAAPALFQTRQELTARRWIAALPAELFPHRPVLSILAVGATMVSGGLTGVEQLLAGIKPWLEPGADLSGAIVHNEAELAPLPAQVAVYRAALALIGGDLAATVAHAERALELAAPDDHLRRGSAAALVGLARWSGGDLAEAEARYANSIRSLTAAGHISDVLGCSLALADIQSTRGRLGDAIATLEAGLDLARFHGVARGTADLHAALCEALLDRHDADGAARHLDAARALGEGAGLPQHPYRWRLAAARLHLAHGDGAAALPLLDEAVARYNTDMSPPVRPASAVRARAHLASGDRAAARRWARDSGLGPDDELSYVREHEHITLARLLLADHPAGGGDAPDVLAFLGRLLAAAEAGDRPGAVVEILVLTALTHEARGHRAEAAAMLDRALNAAGPEHLVGVVADERPSIDPLLAAVAAGAAAGDGDGAGDGADLARELLTAGPAAPGPAEALAPAPAIPPPAGSPVARQRGLVDPLSARELDVLRLLRGDLSGPEMARELHVSLNTLRTHTQRIYTKLDAKNRREAVRRAAELGL